MISGRLDIRVPDSVASKLAELTAAPKKPCVVDLSSLQFLASIGIRALITSAKAVQQRGGKMVLVVDDGSTVGMSLEATGVDELIPVFRNASDAERRLSLTGWPGPNDLCRHCFDELTIGAMARSAARLRMAPMRPAGA